MFRVLTVLRVRRYAAGAAADGRQKQNQKQNIGRKRQNTEDSEVRTPRSCNVQSTAV